MPATATIPAQTFRLRGEPLVMLRVGASSGSDSDDRLDLERKPIHPLSVANKHEDPVGIPGVFFE